MARSLNKVTLIGNLTRDPELRYTPQGTAVCTLGLATNRQWATESGEKKEEAEFHRLVAWNKLAEICSQLLKKGRKIYVEGRLQTRSWTGQDGNQRTTTEIVISDMIILDSRRDMEGSTEAEIASDSAFDQVPSVGTEPAAAIEEVSSIDSTGQSEEKPKGKKKETVKGKDTALENPEDDEIPF